MGDDLVELNSLVAGATFRIEKTEQLLQGLGVGRVPEEGAVASDLNQILVLELFQVVGQGRIGDAKFALDLADDKAVRMSGEEKLHNPQPRLRPHRRKH